MESVHAKRGSLFRSKKRTSLALFTSTPHTGDVPMIVEREEMVREEALSRLTTLLLHHRSEVGVPTFFPLKFPLSKRRIEIAKAYL